LQQGVTKKDSIAAKLLTKVGWIMLKNIKKITYVSSSLFLLLIVFILLADQFAWSIGSWIIPLILLSLLFTLLSMLVVSIISISQSIQKHGVVYVIRSILTNWLILLAISLTVAFIKKELDLTIILYSTLALSVLSHPYTQK